VSGQLGRRRDPRVRLEQPPFVRGITSAEKEKKKKCFNVQAEPPRPRRGDPGITKVSAEGDQSFLQQRSSPTRRNTVIEPRTTRSDQASSS